MGQIFVSYSRRDSDFVDRLIHDLGQNGFNLWMDRTGIGGGDRWRTAIAEAIHGCEAFLIVLSPQSIDSDNVAKELSIADSHKRHIIPLRYQPCEIPLQMEYQLADLQLIDFGTSYPDAFNELVKALGAKPEARTRSAKVPSSAPSAPPPQLQTPMLASLLPGTWQIQIGSPAVGVVGQISLQILPNGFFQGQVMGPMGASAINGQWQITPLNQLMLQGQQTNGFQVVPYGTIIQFTQVTPNQLAGLSSQGEQTVWQKVA